MSAGNACAAIGLANTSKIPMIGGYIQDSSLPGPGADGPCIGPIDGQYWSYNWLGEVVANPVFTVPATSGAAAGKTATWGTNTANLTVPADGKLSVSAAGVITATATTGLYKTSITPGVVIPANSFFWAFLL